MSDRGFGPFQLAANKLKQFAIDNGMANDVEIKLDGLLGDDWDAALKKIVSDDRLRGRFDYGVLREVRDDPALDMTWFRFVGSYGQSFPGHAQFLQMIGARAREEAEGTQPVPRKILYNRVCGRPDHW